MTPKPFSADRIARFHTLEAARFLAEHPRCAALHQQAQRHFLFGVPMHWMADAPTPVPLYVDKAQGARLFDVDGHELIDFCLGDTGAMSGHSPAAIARTLAEHGADGATTMLPSTVALEVADLLEQRFGLPMWQFTATASDANRFVLRWARAITQRRHIVVFNGCYHGAVDDVLSIEPHGAGWAVPLPPPRVVGEVKSLPPHSWGGLGWGMPVPEGGLGLMSSNSACSTSMMRSTPAGSAELSARRPPTGISDVRSSPAFTCWNSWAR